MYADDDTIARTCGDLVRALADGKIDRDTAVERIGTITYAWITTDIALAVRFRDQDSPFEVYYAFIRKIVRNAETVRKALDAGAPPQAYLWTIAKNAAMDRLKVEEREAERHGQLQRTLDTPGQFEPRQEIDLLKTEQHRRLHCAIQELNQAECWLITQRYFKDMCTSEIAAALGCSQKDVHLRLAKARRKLGKSYRKRWPA